MINLDQFLLPATPDARLRLDKFLFYTRFFKSRQEADNFCTDRGVRINGEKRFKPHSQVKAGDVLTFIHQDHVTIIRVLRLPKNRIAPKIKDHVFEDVGSERN